MTNTRSLRSSHACDLIPRTVDARDAIRPSLTVQTPRLREAKQLETGVPSTTQQSPRVPPEPLKRGRPTEDRAFNFAQF